MDGRKGMMDHKKFVEWLVRSGFQLPENTDGIEGIKVNDSHYCTIAEFKEMKELIDYFQGACMKEEF
jgi:hypothetical protein